VLGDAADGVVELLAEPTIAGRDIPVGLSSAAGIWPTTPVEGAVGCVEGVVDLRSAGALGVAVDGVDELPAGPAVPGRDVAV
jgi:hypothetical protein